MKIEQYEIEGLSIRVVRLDQESQPPLPSHYKVNVLREIVAAKSKTYALIGAFGYAGSSWQRGLPLLCNERGVQSTLCYATNPRNPKLPEWVRQAKESGAHIEYLKPNIGAINARQAQKHIEAQGGYFLPFGLDTPELTTHLMNMDFGEIPNDATLVTCAGSGATLAGLLSNRQAHRQYLQNVIAVSAGRPLGALEKSISAKVDAYTRNQIVLRRFELVDGYSYSQIPKVESPWPTHSYYERKAFHWVTQNVERLAQMQPLYFLNVGIE